MPSIIIKELDETTGGGSSQNNNIVYIPGFMSRLATAWPADDDGFPNLEDAAPAKTPTLCNTIAEFERAFGKVPAKVGSWAAGTGYTSGVKYSALSSIINTTTISVEPDDYFIKAYDPSYIYAKELINQGIPVLYEALYTVTNPSQGSTPAPADTKYVIGGTDVGADVVADDIIALYDYVSDGTSGPFVTLKSVGEFEVKYLTTGGYPNFEVGIDDTAAASYAYEAEYDDIADEELGWEIVDETTTPATSVDARVLVNGVDAKTTPPTPEQCEKLATDLLENFDNITKDTTNALATATFTIVFKDQTVKVTPKLPTMLSINPNGKLEEGKRYTFHIKFSYIANHPLNTTNMLRECASSRGDCIAFIDHFNSATRPLVGTGSVCDEYKQWAQNDKEGYATMFTPWPTVTTVTLHSSYSGNYPMPGSYAYLSAFAQSIKNNAPWLAIAGVARGVVPNLYNKDPFTIKARLTNAIAEQEYQNRDDVSLNAITNIKPFGFRIWGNRTSKDNSEEGNLTATSFLNIRNLICDVKKVVYQACRKYTFEQNNDVLWTNFKAYIEPTLERMRTGAGISGYKIIKGTTTEKAKLVATIRLYPIYAVEDFEITVVMADEEISVQ